MADVYTRIGYIKGATGATGAQGAKGDTGDAATIEVGTVTTVPYGQTASVVNSGTSGAAVFDFTIPQGRPGQETTDMQNLVIGAITTSSASFPIPAVGETGKVLWGKVVKWFSDMAALVATKLNAANVVNNLTTTESGYALDARQGKYLGSLLTTYEQATFQNTTYFNGNFTVERNGSLGSIKFTSATVAFNATSNWVTLFILPVQYRPRSQMIFNSTDLTSAYTISIRIIASGEVQVFTVMDVPARQFRIYETWWIPSTNIVS